MRPRLHDADSSKPVVLYLFLLLGLAATMARGDEPRPNVVFVLVDDMGYADVGCYGAKDIRTPNVDRLAREGTRMTDFYSNGPVCSPTRCGFITGRWQQRAGLEWALGVTSQCFVRDSQGQGQGQTLRPDPNFKQFGLPARAGAPTLARLLADSGYATACIGKWHLGWTPECSPAAHGFGTAFGIYGGNADLYSHKGRDGTDDLYENGKPVHEEGYLTELLTRRAERFIAENRDRPFFLYVPYNAVHWPFQPPGRPDLVRSYATWYEGDRRVYAQMVEAIDSGVGAIRAALERAGLLDKTLFIFSNDNGGEVRLTSNRPLFHHKATVWEGGIRVPCILRWPGHLPAGVGFAAGRDHDGPDRDDPGRLRSDALRRACRSTASTWRRSSPAGNPSRCARSAGGSTGSSGSRRRSATASGSSWSTARTTWSGTSCCSTWRPISASAITSPTSIPTSWPTCGSGSTPGRRTSTPAPGRSS